MKLDYNNLERFIGFRLFHKEWEHLKKVVRYSEDQHGYKKYDNVSHAVRCAVMQMLRDEYPKIQLEKGRPKK